MKAFIRIYNFIRYDIWQTTETGLTRSRRFLYHLVKTLVLAVRGYIKTDLNVRASALTYSVVFALIPFFALVISISKGFGVENIIQNFLQDTIIGQTDSVPIVMDFVDRYLKTMRGGLFIGIGIGILFWSVMNFFMQVEKAFNGIWQVKKSRSFLRQFTTYFSIILIIPLLIAFSSGFSIYVSSALKQTYIYEVLSPLLRFGMKLIPYFINWFVFTILYMIVPNTKVRFNNALIAGLIAGTAFQAFQMLYINIQVYLSRYNVVYGSFAAIPLLLFWIQVSCLIVLLGAEISYASQNFRDYEFEIDINNISTRSKNFLTLFISSIIVRQFENQQPAYTSEQIAQTYQLPIRLVHQIIADLVEVNVVVEVISETSKLKTYLPAFDINKLTVNMLLSKLDNQGSEFFFSNNNELLDCFWQKTLKLKEKSDEYLNNVLVKDL
jgi:membrane protein